MALTMEAKLSSMSTMSDASLATSVPERPMEKPTSAARERGPVVGAVARDGHRLAGGAQALDQPLLVVGAGSRQHLQARQHGGHVGQAEPTEGRTLHDEAGGGEDAGAARHGGGRLGVVARHHAHAHAGGLAERDGLSHARAQRVLDGEHADEDQVAAYVVQRYLGAGSGVGRRRGGPGCEGPVGKAEGPQGLGGRLVDEVPQSGRGVPCLEARPRWRCYRRRRRCRYAE